MKKDTRELIGFVGVDSGQLMITDPCYVKDFKSDEYEEDKKEVGKYSYNGACHTTDGKLKGGPLKFKLGHEGAGVVFSSGYGDGTYGVYATYNNEGRVAKVEIIMIDNENEDGEIN